MVSPDYLRGSLRFRDPDTSALMEAPPLASRAERPSLSAPFALLTARARVSSTSSEPSALILNCPSPERLFICPLSLFRICLLYLPVRSEKFRVLSLYERRPDTPVKGALRS